MRRREAIALLGGAAITWPLPTRAQPSAKLPIIGFLGASTSAAWVQWVAPFVQRLHELGWIDGRTITIEYRWGEGRRERYTEIAAEFVRLNVDVIVTGGAAVHALKEATSKIPVVFAVAGDPLGEALVASLARPGGNVTGLSIQRTDMAGKLLGLLREVLPELNRLAIMGNASYPAAVLEMNEVQTIAKGLGIEVTRPEVRRKENIVSAFRGLKEQVQAIYVCTDPLINANRVRINTLALTERLPTIHGAREYVEAGGLMSYGPNYPALFRRSADFVDKILRGTRPGEIQVEQPTKFDLVVNLITAEALGITIPQSLLARADEVIE